MYIYIYIYVIDVVYTCYTWQPLFEGCLNICFHIPLRPLDWRFFSQAQVARLGFALFGSKAETVRRLVDPKFFRKLQDRKCMEDM